MLNINKYKNMRNKIILIGIVCIIVVGIIVSISQNKENDGVLRLGVLLPLSGNTAFIGEDMKAGIELAFENKDDTVIEYEDSMESVQGMVSAYQHIVATFNPDVIIAGGTGVDAIIKLAENDKIPLVLSVSSSSGLPAQGEYIFRYFTNADSDAPKMADFGTKELGYKKFAVIYIQDQFGIDYKNIFTDTVEKNGGAIVAEESYTYADFDFRTQLSKIKEKDFDTFYLVGLDYQLIPLLQQIKALGFKQQILSVGTIGDKNGIAKAGTSIEGVYANYFCTDGTPKEYADRFQNRYNRAPGFFSEIGYDMSGIIKEASKKGDNNEALRAGLSKIKEYQGNQGVITADATGEMVIPLCVKQIRDGKIYNLETKQYSNY